MAKVDEVNVAFEYEVTDAPVRITIEIGDAQIGGSALILDGTMIGKPGAVKNVSLGGSLKGKSLLARTLVGDVNKQTNWTSVRYTLTGGANHPPFTFSHLLENDGDAARYNTTITFVGAET